MAGGARVVIGADVSDVKPKLDSVSKSVLQMEGQLNGSFQGWVGNTNAVATATEKLERQMKSFASEQRTQGRMARFYANELASIIPVAGETQRALQGLLGLGIEGLAGGVGIGLAFEAVKFSIEVVNSAMKHSEEIAKDVEAAQLAVGTVAYKGWKSIQEQIDKATEGMKAYRSVLEGAQPDLDKALKAVNDIRERGPGLWATALAGMGRVGPFDEWIAQYQEASAAFARAVSVASNQADIARAVQQEQARAAQAHLADAVLAKDTEEKRLKLARERAQVEEATRKATQLLNENFAKGWAAGEFPDMAFNQSTLDSMQVFKDQKAGDAAQQKLNESFAAGWVGGEFPDLDTKLEKAAEHGMTLAQAGAAVSDTFAAAGQAIGGMAGSMAATFGKLIQQAIQLAVAISGSAGPLGWLNAAAAAATMIATIASVPEFRAAGGPVVAGRPYIVGERGPELMVPGQSGTVIPNSRLGGSVVIQVSAMDALSFERALRSNDSALMRVIRDATRGGA